MGFPEVGAEASVCLEGPPTIISHRTQFGIQGDNVRLECVAFSIPKPEHVTWTYSGNEVDADDKDYTILEDPLPEGIKSTLVIRESRQQHFGPYKCSVTNPYGSDVVEIYLKPQRWAEELDILRKQYREAQRKLAELQNQYEGFQKVLQEIEDKVQAALDSAK